MANIKLTIIKIAIMLLIVASGLFAAKLFPLWIPVIVVAKGAALYYFYPKKLLLLTFAGIFLVAWFDAMRSFLPQEHLSLGLGTLFIIIQIVRIHKETEFFNNLITGAFFAGTLVALGYGAGLYDSVAGNMILGAICGTQCLSKEQNES